MYSDINVQALTKKGPIKPYRKYQLFICLQLIVFIFLFIKVFSFSTSMNYKLKQSESLEIQLENINQYSTVLDMARQNLEANLLIFDLNNESNIDTIHSYLELDMINEWIVNDHDVQYLMCYKATRDGDNSGAFLTKCGQSSPLLVVIETVEGYRFGGFTTESFDKTFSYKTDFEAFVFSLDTKKKYNIIIPEKALNDRGLPCFGVSDINLKDGFLRNTESTSKFPDTFEKDEEATGDYILTGGVRHFQVKEMEVFFAFIQYSKY